MIIILTILLSNCVSTKKYKPRKYNTTKCPGYSSGYYWDTN